jgi:hypothetical protein
MNDTRYPASIDNHPVYNKFADAQRLIRHKQGSDYGTVSCRVTS